MFSLVLASFCACDCMIFLDLVWFDALGNEFDCVVRSERIRKLGGLNQRGSVRTIVVMLKLSKEMCKKWIGCFLCSLAH